MDTPELQLSLKEQIVRKWLINQSRIFGEGVGLGLFPSDSLESHSYDIIEIAHIGPYYGVENDCRKFRSNRLDSFSENQKISKMAVFWPFWDTFGNVSHIPTLQM